jgi:hypothetical protein
MNHDRWMLALYALGGLGASFACAAALPLPAYKALVGVAFIVALITGAFAAYQRFVQVKDTPAVTEEEVA